MLRIAYSIEFLIAIIAIFTFWSEVGGQGHLDLMPWYWKFGFSLAAAAVCLKLTATTLERQSIWSRSALRWLLALALLSAAAGAVTYYVHLNEPADADDGDTVYSSSMVSESLRGNA
ncbi:MAG: hypothetical protein M3Z85_09635 [Acidobacteriota bacterium]|nr:hypothetical protein [Acidobacteriota bacterium]